MKRKILTIMIICLMLASFSINVFSNNEINNLENTENTEAENKTLEEQRQDIEDKLRESNKKIEYVKSEISTTLQKVQEFNDSIIEYENKYNQLQNDIMSKENEIKETDNSLKLVEDEYIKKDRLLKKRVVALYESGKTTYLDVLLSSKSIMDFISNYYILEQIIEFDNELLEELYSKKQDIERKKIKQEKQQTDLKVARTRANQMKILLENKKMILENYAMQLNEEERNLNEQIEKYKVEQAEIERLIQASLQWSGKLDIDYKGGVMIWPIGIKGTYITSPYGSRLHPIKGVIRYHDGIDIGNAGYGAPVIAATDGVVTYAGRMGGYGNCVMLYNGSGIATLYGHGQEIKVEVGMNVKQGDLIMTVGSTGVSTGPHLHFEVRKDGTPVDPIPFLKGDKKEENNNKEGN